MPGTKNDHYSSLGAPRHEISGLAGKMFIEVAEDFQDIDNYYPPISLQKLAMKGQIGMIPVGVTLGNAGEEFCRTQLEVHGIGINLPIQANMEICEIENPCFS